MYKYFPPARFEVNSFIDGANHRVHIVSCMEHEKTSKAKLGEEAWYAQAPANDLARHPGLYAGDSITEGGYEAKSLVYSS
jgi:CHAD domain-containing protein